MIIIPLSELLCCCQSPKNEANGRRITDFGKSQLQQQLLCYTHTVKNGGFISQNTPEDKQASLHRCMCAKKVTRANTGSFPDNFLGSMKVAWLAMYLLFDPSNNKANCWSIISLFERAHGVYAQCQVLHKVMWLVSLLLQLHSKSLQAGCYILVV